MSSSPPPSPSPPSGPGLALIGFGEAGETFARAGSWAGRSRGWDIAPARRAMMARHGVEPGASAAEALAGAVGVLSLVTADQALAAARECAPHLATGCWWCDMNSVAPATKQAAAEVIAAAGGRYVDVAVMAPVDKALAVPLLLSGPDAGAAGEFLATLGFGSTRVVGDRIGQASAIKLCRSVMIKGLEALAAEMAMAADGAGVLDEVVASLDASETALGWRDRVNYSLERMLRHGTRRAAEMREAHAMLAGMEAPSMMTAGTVRWQQALGAIGAAPIPDGLAGKLAAIDAADLDAADAAMDKARVCEGDPSS